MNFAYQTLFYLISLFLVASAAKAAAPDRIELHAESGDHHHSDDRRDRVSFDADFVFKIPGEIILEEGKPGDLEGKLTFKVAGNKSVECEYELTENHRNKKHRHHGDSAIPWAPTAIEIIPLEHCSRGYHAGTLVTTRSLSLKLEQEGDHHHSKFAAISVVLINERPNGPQLVTVPSLAGTDQIAAVAALSAVGLVPGTTTLINSSNIAKDLLISQQPLAGVQIAKGAAVNLVFSLGPVMVSVPSLTGMNQVAAIAALTALGLAPGTIALSNSTSISKDLLISQEPLAGAVIPQGATVNLVFSLGPVMVTVPSLTGLNQLVANATLVLLGLVPGNVTFANSNDISQGLLVSQTPLSGIQTAQGSTVDLVFSLGPIKVPVPTLTGLTQSSAEAEIIASGLTIGQVLHATSATAPNGTVISQEPAAGLQVNFSSSVSITVADGPVLVGGDEIVEVPEIQSEETFEQCRQANLPVIDQAGEGSHTQFYDAFRFIFTGVTPLQVGVPANAISRSGIAVFWGRLRRANDAPVVGAKIEIKDHPEYGYTLSGACGEYYLALEGGGEYTLKYSGNNLLKSYRKRASIVHEVVRLEDVVLKPRDPIVTNIDLAAMTKTVVATGSVITDRDGERTGRLLFPAGTTATMVNQDGSEQMLNHISVRLTEVTVGNSGIKSMLSPMPLTTAYMYAADLSLDEAPDAKQVHFNKEIPFYVDNFLRMPIGTVLPVGYYNEGKSVWESMPNGMVISIVGFTNQAADVDLGGDGVAESSATLLTALGIDETERQALYETYRTATLPKQLWRTTTNHFTMIDINHLLPPFISDRNNSSPPNAANNDNDADAPSCQNGSIIECENRGLGEEIALAGTASKLVYRSKRMRAASYSNSINIDALVDDFSKSNDQPIDTNASIEVTVAGRRFLAEKPYNDSNKKFQFVWDGKDLFGRKLTTSQPMEITTTYHYPGYYQLWAGLPPVFYPELRNIYNNLWEKQLTWLSDRTFILSGARQAATASTTIRKRLGQPDPRDQGFGGWTLSQNHYADPASGTIYFGNGENRTQTFSPYAIVKNRDFTDAPFGAAEFRKDASSTLMGPDGRLYSLSIQQIGSSPAVYSIDATNRLGIIEHVVGNPENPYSDPRDDGTDGNKTVFSLDRCRAPDGSYPDFVFGPDNALYFADCPGFGTSALIRKLDLATKKVTTVAGNLQASQEDLQDPLGGQGKSALAVGIYSPGLIVLQVDGSGNIYFNHQGSLQRISSSGIVEHVAGGNANGSADPVDGDLAKSLRFVTGAQLDSKGNVYISDTFSIYRIDGVGKLVRLAGTNSTQDSRDGLLARDTHLVIRKFGFDKNDQMYFMDHSDFISRLRYVTNDDRIATILGSTEPSAPDAKSGLAALSVKMPYFTHFSFDSQNHPMLLIYELDTNSNFDFHAKLVTIEKNPGTLSADGSEMYTFDDFGTHLKTIDTLTGADLLVFSYDSNHRLIAMTDNFGNVTQIVRDNVTGLASEIIAPFGQTTKLGYSPSGFLNDITNPLGHANAITYHTDASGDENGLLATFRSGNGNTSHYSFDETGRLETAADPLGATKTLSGVNSSDGSQRVKYSSAMGKLTEYYNKVDPIDQHQEHITAFPNGTKILSTTVPGVRETASDSSGATSESSIGSDPRFGIEAPFSSSILFKPNASTQYKLTTTKTGTGLGKIGDPTFATLITTSQINDNPNRIFKTVIDAATKTITGTSPLGFQNVAHYNLLSQVTANESSGMYPQRFEYDDKGRLLNSYWGPIGCIASSPDCRVTAYNYVPVGQNGAGLLGSVTSAEGTQIAILRDAVGRVTKAFSDPAGLNLTTNLSYDANGNLTAVAPAGKPVHAFEFDGRDMSISYNPPDVLGGGTPDFDQYEYDADRYLTRELLPEGATRLSVQYQYDAGGELLAKIAPEGTTRYSYDPATKFLTNITAVNGSSVALTYNGSLLTQENIRLPFSNADYQLAITNDAELRLGTYEIGGSVIDYRYDFDGLLNGTGELAIFRNSVNGLLAGTELSSGASKIETSYQYNGFGEILRAVSSLNGTALLDVSYSYNKLSRITGRQELRSDGTHENLSYGYDAVGRLVSIAGDSAESYTYDSNGNRLNNSAVYDDQDRLVNTGDYYYFYSSRGSLTEKRPTGGGASTFYNYSTEGELLSVTLADGKVVKYESDGLGRRISRSYNGETLGFIYKDQLEPIADVNADGSVRSVYVYAEKSHVPSYMIRGAEKFAIISDERGSVRLVVAMSSGVVVQELKYDSWGRVLLDSKPGFQPFGYAGGIYDFETNLVRFGGRDYDSKIGRWLDKDPSGLSGGLNIYAYSANDSINYIDLDGRRQGLSVDGGGGGGTGGGFGIPSPSFGGSGLSCSGSGLGALGSAGALGGASLGSLPSSDIFKADSKQPGDTTDQSAQAPGIPTAEDGFKPAKDWDGKTKVRAANGRGYGYPDKSGRIWIPTRPGKGDHGGPHWDVQDARGGGYKNILPGGKER